MQGRGLALKKRKQAKMLFSPMVLVVEAFTPKMLSHFWGPHEPSGFDSHIYVQDLLNKKNLCFTRKLLIWCWWWESNPHEVALNGF